VKDALVACRLRQQNAEPGEDTNKKIQIQIQKKYEMQKKELNNNTTGTEDRLKRFIYHPLFFLVQEFYRLVLNCYFGSGSWKINFRYSI